MAGEEEGLELVDCLGEGLVREGVDILEAEAEHAADRFAAGLELAGLFDDMPAQAGVDGLLEAPALEANSRLCPPRYRAGLLREGREEVGEEGDELVLLFLGLLGSELNVGGDDAWSGQSGFNCLLGWGSYR